MRAPCRRLARLLLPLTVGAASSAVLAGPATATPECEAGRSQEAATVCWLNVARARARVAPVHQDARLARAAERHSRDMVTHSYFAHDSRDGAAFSSRIAATGWMRHRSAWRVGETLAWGTGPRAEPAAIVQAWLNSPPHRRIVLSARFRLVGIGTAQGTPIATAPDGATFTADFGS